MREFVIKLLSAPILFYRKFISPMFGARCMYYPTCSAYALEALKKHGPIAGTLLAVWRILRCNPWSAGGIDRVPDKITKDYLFGRKREK